MANIQRRIQTRSSSVEMESEPGADCNIDQADELYGRIFGAAPMNMLCGEITPRYAILPDIGIQHILRLQPAVKFIFIMRDPIERIWSALRMQAETAANPVEEVTGRTITSVHLDQTDYVATLRLYARHVTSDRFLKLIFDDIVERPFEVLQSVCEFLGIDFSREFFGRVSQAKNEGPRVSMSAELYDELRARLRPIYDQLLTEETPAFKRWFGKHYDGGEMVPKSE
jgi:hypothetical protein